MKNFNTKRKLLLKCSLLLLSQLGYSNPIEQNNYAAYNEIDNSYFPNSSMGWQEGYFNSAPDPLTMQQNWNESPAFDAWENEYPDRFNSPYFYPSNMDETTFYSDFNPEFIQPAFSNNLELNPSSTPNPYSNANSNTSSSKDENTARKPFVNSRMPTENGQATSYPFDPKTGAPIKAISPRSSDSLPSTTISPNNSKATPPNNFNSQQAQLSRYSSPAPPSSPPSSLPSSLPSPSSSPSSLPSPSPSTFTSPSTSSSSSPSTSASPAASQAATPTDTSPTTAPQVITPTDGPAAISPSAPGSTGSPENAAANVIGPINFNNVSIIEYIRFVSRVTNRNFIFEEDDLQFNVTIISEEPTSTFNLMTALLQELKIRDLSLMEQGNSIIIHRNPRIRAPGHIVTDEASLAARQSEIITRVFRLNTLDPLKATEIFKPLLSDDALVEVLRDTNNLIITDLVANVDKIAQLIHSLDAPNSGVTVGQYVVRNGFVDSLVDLASRIIFPIAQGNPFVLVPHASSNSVFIVSNPFIVEKSLAILQNLDNNDGKTKIFSLDKLYPTGYNPETGVYTPVETSTQEAAAAAAAAAGRLPGPGQLPALPPGAEFPGGAIGRGSSIYNEASEFLPGGISAASRLARDLPAGHIERTLFFIYKLKYRRGSQLEVSLRKIAYSLMATGLSNADLVAAINSTQWIESSNALIFAGTISALEKLKELILEIDTPLHQVYIEMLILDTTLEDSLTYGVNWGVLFGGGNTSGGETFITEPQGTDVFNSLKPNVNAVPNAKPLLGGEGFDLGIIGKHLTHNGMHFSTISALVKALHRNDKAHIILNPRIITEDNVTAEVFVGETDRYKTQSISNDQGDVITNNFAFIDVGTTLRVTPLIGNNGVITLDIIEEVTKPAPQANTSSDLSQRVDVNLVPVLQKHRSTTRLHVPNGFFVVMSGLIDTQDSVFKNEIPCLGMIPLIGGAGKYKRMNDRKRNLMIFIRPIIVDTECELEEITKRQQDVYRDKGKSLRAWNFEIDQALDYFNIKSTDPDEMPCQLK